MATLAEIMGDYEQTPEQFEAEQRKIWERAVAEAPIDNRPLPVGGAQDPEFNDAARNAAAWHQENFDRQREPTEMVSHRNLPDLTPSSSPRGLEAMPMPTASDSPFAGLDDYSAVFDKGPTVYSKDGTLPPGTRPKAMTETESLAAKALGAPDSSDTRKRSRLVEQG